MRNLSSIITLLQSIDSPLTPATSIEEPQGSMMPLLLMLIIIVVIIISLSYIKKMFSKNYILIAKQLLQDTQLYLDKNNVLALVKIIDCEEKNKEQLYIIINFWVSNTFNDANSVIQLNDKESGVIICQGYLSEISSNTGFLNQYVISVKPVFKIDIKDNKIRVTYTVMNYEINRSDGMLSNITNKIINSPTHEVWPLNQTYPFNENDSHKKTSSKAFVSTIYYSADIINSLENAVKEGVVGNEVDDW